MPIDIRLYTNTTLTLTANKRLATHLQARYAAYQQQLGHTAWPSPKILPITTWLEKMSLAYLPHEQRLLTPIQEQLLWQKIIQKNNFSVLNLQNTTLLAMKAWELLCLWDVPLETLDRDHGTVGAFATWCAQFIKTCEDKKFITHAELATALAEILSRTRGEPFFNCPQKIYLIGFLEIPPAWQALLKVLASYCEIEKQENNPGPIAADICRTECQDNEAEMIHMALFAKKQLTTQPGQKIACIVPNLQKQRDKVEQYFTDIFAIENLLPGTSPLPLPFNLSVGKKLSLYPLIQMAITMVRLAQGTFSCDLAVNWLQSPYLCQTAEDVSIGAALAVSLQKFQTAQLPLASLYKPLTQLLSQYPKTTWLNRWRRLQDVLAKLPSQTLPSQWASHFIHLLQALGWPGGRSLTSHEYQILQRWLEMLQDYRTLDNFCGNLTLTEAIDILSLCTEQIVFQPQSDDAPIQILGILESIGLDFDSVWVMGLDDHTWPVSAQPNPFLPIHLQIAHNMPHANAKRELEFAAQCTQELLHCAKKVVLSSPQQLNEQHLHCSQLIHQFPVLPLQELTDLAYQPFTQQLLASVMETFFDPQGPGILASEHISGGSGILKQQSACPFRAFSIYRLLAPTMTEFYTGISPSERGNLVHKALERFWLQIKTHQQLSQMTEAKLNSLLIEIIKTVINESLSLPFITKTLLALEQQRLQNLLFDWLNLEKQRPDFTVIQQETAQSFTLNSLKLTLKIDRIDQLEDGSLLLIDYKTGETNIYDWFGARPREPQLPLYYLAAQNNTTTVTAISFAQVRPGTLQFKGIAQECYGKQTAHVGITPINQIKTIHSQFSWQSLHKHWHTVLSELAGQFTSGHAQVDPVNTEICQQCHLQSLCRIHGTKNVSTR